MNYYTTMAQSFEKEKNKQASLITAGIAGAMILAFIFLKWPLPKIEIPPQEAFIEVDLNLPEDIRTGGGGGGGNPVQAIEEKGTAYSPPQPGVLEDTKDFETDDKDESSPPVVKPANPKPNITKVNTSTSTVKTEPKPVVTTPAPPKPKAIVGKTLTGGGTGGGTAEDYDRSGGSGTGNGVGRGPGSGGGTGGGTGGGNGTGAGTGNGPRRVSGNRVVINPKSMNAGENLKGKVFAEIRVSPDGIGTFVRATRGSTYTGGEAIEIIREWLRRNRFNKADAESTVVYEFNFLLGG
jgi:hypothetical protein